MNDCLVNIRIFSRHFKLLNDPYGKITITRNTWHKANNWPDGYFKVYEFRAFLP